jgi:DNA-binding NarL/FixJ family response regulator
MAVRCLIIDDNDRFLEAAREALERDGIVVVGVASDGAEAMDRTLELRPDVILVDVCLGEESGFALTESIASACRAWRPCLILVSTYAKRDFEDMLETSSACAFLSKAQLSGLAIREIVSALCVGGVTGRLGRL